MNELTSTPMAATPDTLITVRQTVETMTYQRLPCFLGISGVTAGAKGLSMNLVVIPPGVPHQAIVARNDANEQEDVVPYDPTTDV